jgi:hypothetical protein
MVWNDPSDNRKPKIVDELYDVGLIISESGPGTRTYMRVDQPGVYERPMGVQMRTVRK